MTTIELEELETAPPEVQLEVLMRSIENLRQFAIEATGVWMTVAGHRDVYTDAAERSGYESESAPVIA